MLTLKPDAIKDFLVCPLYFQYKHVDELPENQKADQIYQESYLSTLKRVASYFFYKRQAEKHVGFDALAKRWSKLWFQDDLDYTELLKTTSKNNQVGKTIKYNTAAVAALERFHSVFSEDDGIPLIIGETRTVQPTQNTRLSVDIDLMLHYDDGSRKVIKWFAGQPKFGKHFLNLEMAATQMAVTSSGAHKKGMTYAMYDFNKPKARIEPVNLTGDDINNVIYRLRQIEERAAPNPNRGFTAYCSSCPFDTECYHYVKSMLRGEDE